MLFYYKREDEHCFPMRSCPGERVGLKGFLRSEEAPLETSLRIETLVDGGLERTQSSKSWSEVEWRGVCYFVVLADAARRGWFFAVKILSYSGAHGRRIP